MPLVTRPATARDQPFAFAVKRAALGAYVAQVWGWDELAQQAYHAADWARHRPDVVELDGTPIGTLEVVDHHDHLYVGEFYLLPEHQSRGLGTELLRRVLARADAADAPVRLQFLKVNPVRSLYERHGFQVTGESATHYFAVRQPARTVEQLKSPTSDADWDVYHAIRRHVLFELRGQGSTYDANHPDEHRSGHHPLIFWSADVAVGVVRIDVRTPVATLRRVAIRADCQRRGYGRRLLEAAEQFAHEHGCSRVESRVDPGAIGFYDRCGYTRVDSSDTNSSPLMAKTLP